MRELAFVGLTDDGAALVLAGGGTRYRLDLDARVLAATRGDRTRWAQLQIELGDAPRPAQIQARIRAGETAEDIAAAAGVDVERVRRYEGPVLAERAHVAERGRASVPRRREGHRPDPGATLEELVVRRLTADGVEPTIGWDAHRREDGAWLVTADLVRDGRATRACWVFDTRARVVSSDDDAARWLLDELPPPVVAEPEPPGQLRLASVPDPVAEEAPDPGPSTDRPGRPPRARGPYATPEEAGLPLETFAPVGPPDGTTAAADPAQDPDGAAPARPAAARGRRRPSVPSWDDIVFGTRKRD